MPRAIARAGCGRGLDLHRDDAARAHTLHFNDHVDLHSCRRSPEVQARRLTAVEGRLEQLTDHQRSQRARPPSGRRQRGPAHGYPTRWHSVPGIGEVHLGRLHEPLAQVGEVGPQREHLVRRFQDAQPALGGGGGDAAGRRPSSLRLSSCPERAARARTKSWNCTRSSTCAIATHIALEVRTQVAVVPETRGKSRLGDELRIQAADCDRPEVIRLADSARGPHV